MGNKHKCCEKTEFLKKTLMLDNPLPAEILTHLETCQECKKEHETFLKMKSIISQSTPKTPPLREAVLDTIKNQNIKISEKQPEKRRFIPLGTIAAAVAVFAIYASVYGSNLTDMIFSQVDDNLNYASDFEYFSDSSESEQEQTKTYASITVQDNEDLMTIVQKEKLRESALEEKTEIVIEAQTDDLAPKNKYALCGYPTTNGTQADNTPEFTQNYTVQDTSSKANNDIAFSDTDAKKDSGNNGGFFNVDEAESVAEPETCLSASELFEKHQKDYPERISEELFEQVGDEIYLAFVSQITDFETQYTKESLLIFAEKFN